MNESDFDLREKQKQHEIPLFQPEIPCIQPELRPEVSENSEFSSSYSIVDYDSGSSAGSRSTSGSSIDATAAQADTIISKTENTLTVINNFHALKDDGHRYFEVHEKPEVNQKMMILPILFPIFTYWLPMTIEKQQIIIFCIKVCPHN